MKACVRNAVLAALLSVYSGAHLFAQGTAFTYQGRLNASGVPATGTYDLRFTVYDSAGGATVVAGPLTGSGVPVANGLFTVSLDFGTGVFTGPARWLQIAVRTNGAVTFTNLSPRQALTPAPYAIHAGTASNVVNGAVVKSLNNLRDNVTLAAGANVTLTPSGNTLTIASTGSNGIWSLNGASAYYNAGNVGVGTTDPTTKLTVRTSPARYGVEHTDGARRLSTYLSGTGGWLGTRSGDPLHFFVNDGAASMTVDTTGNIGIGTTSPQSKLHLYQPDESVSHVIETGGGVNAWARVSLRNLNGQWDIGTSRTFNGDQLYFSRLGAGIALGLQPNGDAFLGGKLTVRTPASDYGVEHTDGNVRLSTYVGGSTGGGYLGTISNHKLSFFVNDQAASMTVDTTGNVGIGTTAPADKLYIAGEGASGYAIGIEGNARQNRDKGGWVKAMAKVNADGSIARQYSALGGTVTALYDLVYVVTFPFRVDDRFVSVTPFYNDSVGPVAATLRIEGCASCGPSKVVVGIFDLRDSSAYVANEFFIFVY